MAYALGVLLLAATSSAFEVTESVYSAPDPARDGHMVTATLYLPSNNQFPAPVIAFAHGFNIGPDDYPLAKRLSSDFGYVVFLPHDLGVLPSTTNLARDQAFLLAHAVSESKSNRSSPLYNRVSNHTVLSGHSLGGGSTLLAADRELAAAYPPPTAIVTVSLGTYTIPPALKSVPKIPASLPALLLTATQDCIDPPAKNSLPAFRELASDCAFVASVEGGTHCHYAAPTLGCAIGEKLCGAKPTISREEQVDRALTLIIPFLNAAFAGKSQAQWADFNSALESAITNKSVELLAHRSSKCANSPTPSHGDLHDSDFAMQCQKKIAHAAKSNVLINLLQADGLTFLTTKPSLVKEASGTVNVTMLMKQEQTAPFTHSVAIKMKSGQAIEPTAPADDVTCAQLHNMSLTTALSTLDAAEREAYGKSTKRLIFASDKLYHTGIYVATSKVVVNETADALTIEAPRFFASTKVPGQWGGVVYCRLVPPTAMRDWIKTQLHNHTQATTLLV